jgi:coenzyme PQQ precursor peptide PqqA
MQFGCARLPQPDRRLKMKWETPSARDMRFGFEITMYIANR